MKICQTFLVKIVPLLIFDRIQDIAVYYWQLLMKGGKEGLCDFSHTIMTCPTRIQQEYEVRSTSK